MRTIPLALACALCTAVPVQAQTRAETPPRESSSLRNPAFLRASEPLARREPADQRVIRLEWEQVHATEYVLQGQWVEPDSWATHRRELSVTHSTASQWDERTVTVELPVEPGAHSWIVVAVFAGRGPGDFVRPTRATFEVR